MKEQLDHHLVIPNESIYLSLLQRAGSQTFWNTRFIKAFLSRVLRLGYSDIVKLESRILRAKAREKLIHEITEQFNLIKPYIPDDSRTVLDIGSGLAFIDVLIYFVLDKPDIYLLDKSQINEKNHHGLRKEDRFYSDNELAKHGLIVNGIEESKIHYQEATEDYAINFGISFDLIISIGSWGFHYPIDTYLKSVHTVLKPGGTLILDIRRDSNGEEKIRELFADVQIFNEWKKGFKIAAKKPIDPNSH